MNIEKISSVVFSPTESTRKVVSLIASRFSQEAQAELAAETEVEAEEINITLPRSDAEKRSFVESDTVIFGIPVYGGRVPEIAAKRLENIKGNNTPAVIVAAYGNRDYDDALLELQTIVEKNGFIVFAAIAVVTEHSIMHSVAKGRPDEADQSCIIAFAEQAVQKLGAIEDIRESTVRITVKGNTPYREYGGVPMKPSSTKACTKCGTCSKNCPVSAIPSDAPDRTSKDTCISCMRCIMVCPVEVSGSGKARELNKLMLKMAERAFAQKCKQRKEPELFI